MACPTGRTFFGSVGRINLLYLYPKTLRFVGDKQGELVEAPGILHPVVFASLRSTTCACRALADTCKGFDFDCAHTLFMGVVDNLTGKLMVDILHPTGFFALAFLHGTCLLGLLKLLPTGIEASPHVPLVPAIAKEAGAPT